ncbi:hypothetical protein RHGRI_014309 [Rhododendron griersonianum]|uniref:Uncharacterized protein n=1 Tax=Rhododendron griersonianum TaxID=479676 RepID=A0AAV6K8W0_9ERIC|nr:hypothetical protein RHGRI_014309 [Rhododendron griersonianum]
MDHLQPSSPAQVRPSPASPAVAYSHGPSQTPMGVQSRQSAMAAGHGWSKFSDPPASVGTAAIRPFWAQQSSAAGVSPAVTDHALTSSAAGHLWSGHHRRTATGQGSLSPPPTTKAGPSINPPAFEAGFSSPAWLPLMEDSDPIGPVETKVTRGPFHGNSG